MLSNLEKIKKNIKILEENGLEINDLTSIDIEGNFTIKPVQTSDVYSAYYGKIMDEGVLYYFTYGSSFPSDMQVYTTSVGWNLVASNIKGYDFVASTFHKYSDHSTFGVAKKDSTKVESNEAKIKSLYAHYKTIIEALENGADDEFVKEQFGLDSFESKELSKQQTK